MFRSDQTTSLCFRFAFFKELVSFGGFKSTLGTVVV